MSIVLKFSFSEKATKICDNLPMVLTFTKYRHSLISVVSISTIFDLTGFILFSSPLVLLSNLNLNSIRFLQVFLMCPHINNIIQGMPVNVKTIWKMAQIVMAFSEKLNFMNYLAKYQVLFSKSFVSKP